MAVATPPASGVTPGTSTTFDVGTWSYVVPPGVTRLLVDLAGAKGTGGVGGLAGEGGRVVAVVLVTPGEVLTVDVGGTGVGNGAGGATAPAGPGGGATDIRRGSSLAGRIVVAGGGGGRGSSGAAGGVGGATPGRDGPSSRSGTGGGAGTVAFGGAGGSGTCSFCTTGTAGGFGSFGSGGAGASRGGGGGGGGYWGGGGGGAGEFGGAGGGGGSSYVAPTGALPVAMEPGARTGNGVAVITPDPTADSPPVVTLVAPTEGEVFAASVVPTFTISAVDPDADLRWVGRIEVRSPAGTPVSTFFTNAAASGESASASPPAPLPPGDYDWTATAVDTRGAASAAPPTRRFTVAQPPPDRPLAVTGGVAFNGQATLETFPCSPPAPFGNGPCAGTFTGAWSGNVSGVSGSHAFDVTWTTPAGRLQAAFDYAEWQCLGGTETVLGVAKGSGGATAEPGEVQGKWQVPGETFARDITRVSASFSFDWLRIGTSAVLVLDPVTLSVDVAGLGTRQVVTTRQTGTAAFAARGAGDIGTAPTCGDPLTDVHGDIAGVLPLVQADR